MAIKTKKGIAKRFRKTNPKKKGAVKLIHQSKGRGTKHLKAKQSNPRKRRIRQRAQFPVGKSVKRVMPSFK